MENTRKADLKQRKISLKSKLMSALAMLLVATVLMGSSTYAWFILSTAPEVKGMSTTVGSNGSLEIALRTSNPEDATENTIGTAVGDSVSATRDWKVTNGTWGNIIDLSDPTYGLTGASNIMLYPARLNLNNEGKIDLTKPLLGPRYGTDGRVATIDKNLTIGGVYTTDGFIDGVGVRGVGDYVVDTEADKEITRNGLALNAQRSMTTLSNSVKSGIGGLLNQYLGAISELQNEGNVSGETGDEIIEFLDGYAAEVARLDAAVGYAYLMEKLADDSWTQKDKTPGEILAEYAAMSLDDIIADTAETSYAHQAAVALQSIKTSAAAAKTAAEGAKVGTEYSASGLRGAIQNIFNYNNMYVQNGETLKRLGDYANSAEKASALVRTNVIYMFGGSNAQLSAGSVADLASIIGKYQFTMQGKTAYATSVGYSEGVSYSSIENPGFLASEPVTESNAVASVYQSNAADGTTYGFVVDLAFRTNDSTTGLALSTNGIERVTGGEAQTAELVGAGSTITADASVREKVYVAFFNPADGTLYAIAKADDQGKLHLCDMTTATGGALTLTEKTGDDAAKIISTPLQSAYASGQSQANVSVLVYLDGDAYDNAGAEGTTVQLNLQFAPTTVLVPMSYTGYTTFEGTVLGGDEQNTVADLSVTASNTSVSMNESTTLSATLNNEPVTSGVTYTVSGLEQEDYELNGNTLTIYAANTATVTVTGSYTDAENVVHTGSVEISVNSAP